MSVCLSQIRALYFSETWGQLVDTQYVKCQNAKGPYTSVSIIFHQVVNQFVLLRWDIFIILCTCPHSPAKKKYLKSFGQSVRPTICHHLDKNPPHIYVEDRFRLAFLMKLYTKNLSLQEHGKPLSSGSPPSRVNVCWRPFVIFVSKPNPDPPATKQAPSLNSKSKVQLSVPIVTWVGRFASNVSPVGLST